MSDSETHQQDANKSPNPDPNIGKSENHPTPSKPYQDSRETTDRPEMPLPNFSRPSKPEPSETSPNISSVSGLDDFLKTQAPTTPESDETMLEAGYKVSPAAPDWSELTMPSPDAEQLDSTEPEAETAKQGWKTAWAVVREVGETIILTLVIFLLIQTVIRNFRVVGTSMVDNLHDGQYLIIDKLSYNPLISENLGIGGPQRGDVVVFEPPNRPGEDYVKRIIALPGETVEVKNGQVFINGTPLNEPFEPSQMSYTMRPQVVPEGTVFVLGDNRNNSNDSHNWGALPIENIVGRAWLSYWPPESWGTIPRDIPTEEATLKYFMNEIVPGANAETENE